MNSIEAALPTQAEIPNNGTILLSDILENIGIRVPNRHGTFSSTVHLAYINPARHLSIDCSFSLFAKVRSL